MSDIFLSYSRDDLTTARRFAEAFEREGLTVWWDQTLNPGEAYDRVTEKALQNAKAVVVLWSKKSVESHWVRSEATQAQSNGTLVPVMIESCKRPIMFELMHTAELAHWKGDSNDPMWRAFLGAVRQFVNKDGAATSPPVAQPVTIPTTQFGVRILVVAATLLVAVAVVFWFANRPSVVAPNPAGAIAAPTAQTTKEVTLAVLPFANLSSDPEQEYFSDGLTEEILNQLAQTKDLVLTGRTSSFSFKGKNEDLRVIAQKLGVANLLEGSIRKNGNQLRITAQLINGKVGTHLWSRTYERELKDVFAVQEEIARDVAQALSIRLDVGDMSRARGGTTNIEAYDRFLRARELFSQGEVGKSAETIQLFQEAAALDPGFARAWQGLHDALVESSMTGNVAALRKQAFDATAHVVALAPDVWWAQAPRALDLLYQRKWSDAEAASSAALAKAPVAEAFKAYGPVDFLLAVGRIKDAADFGERARKVDPLSLSVSSFLQILLYTADRRADSEAEYQRGRSLAGDHTEPEQFRRWVRLLELSATDPLRKSRLREVVSNDPHPLPLGAVLVDKFDDKAGAREAIRAALEDPAYQDPSHMMNIADYADLFESKDLALAALRRRVVDQGGIPLILWQVGIPGIRRDPDFKQILREVGLADYFRASGNWGDFCKPVGKDDFECH